MLGPVIILVVISTGFIIAVFAIEKWEDRVYPVVWGSLCYITICAWLIVNAVNGTYKDGQIDVLKGIQAYEIHYVYPKGDTIPSDTLYLKIEE